MTDGDTGRAQTHFAEALGVVPDAKQNAAFRALSVFFRQAAREDRADFCAELLEMIRERGLERVLAALEPFAKAVEYWQKGGDAEVLERLNPEMREIVEEIIQGKRGDEERREEEERSEGEDE